MFFPLASRLGNIAQGKGVYQFEDKYGANVDGYSPIYTPNAWSANGDTYKLGTTGLAIWCARPRRKSSARAPPPPSACACLPSPSTNQPIPRDTSGPPSWRVAC